MTREKLIEAMARACMEAAWARIGGKCDVRDDGCEHGDCPCSDVALMSGEAALAALETAIPGLADVLNGKSAIVPVGATDAIAFAGHAAIAQAVDMYPGREATAKAYADLLAASPYRATDKEKRDGP